MFERVLSVAAVVASAALSQAAVLYDGTSPLPVLITQSPWNWAPGQSSPSSSVPSVSYAGNATVLDTTNNSDISAGFNIGGLFANPLIQPISPTATNSIRFTVAVSTESHSSTNRAGFSVIMLSSTSAGIELGFWQDQIWAQQIGFSYSASEAVPFNPTTPHTYDLTFAGNSYTLSESNTPLLSGALRIYPAAFPASLVYGQANYLFMGDDTTSAAGVSQISHVEQFIPEPAGLSLLLLGSGLAFRRRWV